MRSNGARKQKAKSFSSAKAAKDFAATTESAILTGRYSDAHGITVGQYLDTWLTTYTINIRPNSLRGYQNAVDVHLKPRIGSEPLEYLTTAKIQGVYNSILKTEYRPAKYEERGGLQVLVRQGRRYSPKTIRNIHAVLLMALKQARIEGLISRNPAEDVKLPSSKEIEYTIPEPEQLQRLLEQLQNAECYLVILTIVLLACRRGEALGLYWTDLDFDKNTVELKRALIVNNLEKRVEVGELKAKNARRTLPLPLALRDILLVLKARRDEAIKSGDTHIVASPFVFTNMDGEPFRPDSISQAFKRAAAKVGLPQMRLHDLRHTGISYMLANGADPKTVSGFVGHATAQFTLNRYGHVLEEAKKRAGAVLESQVLLPGKNPS